MSDSCVSCTALATQNASLQILFRRPTPAIVFETAAKPTRLVHFWQGVESIAPATQNEIWTSKVVQSLLFTMLTCKRASGHSRVHFWAAQLPKVLQEWCVLYLSGCKCASRHNGVFSTSQLPKMLREWCVLHLSNCKCALRHSCVHFFDISTSKSGQGPSCFEHFDFKICFAPQRAIYDLASDHIMSPHPPL